MKEKNYTNRRTKLLYSAGIKLVLNCHKSFISYSQFLYLLNCGHRTKHINPWSTAVE